MGNYPEHLHEIIAVDLNEDIYDRDLEKLTAKDYEKPKCYTQNNDPSDPDPLCTGANTPQGLAENDCYTCCLYENMRGPYDAD